MGDPRGQSAPSQRDEPWVQATLAPEAGEGQPAGFPWPVLSPSPTLARLRGSVHWAPLRASNCRAVPQLAGDPVAAEPLLALLFARWPQNKREQ